MRWHDGDALVKQSCACGHLLLHLAMRAWYQQRSRQRVRELSTGAESGQSGSGATFIAVTQQLHCLQQDAGGLGVERRGRRHEGKQACREEAGRRSRSAVIRYERVVSVVTTLIFLQCGVCVRVHVLSYPRAESNTMINVSPHCHNAYPLPQSTLPQPRAAPRAPGTAGRTVQSAQAYVRRAAHGGWRAASLCPRQVCHESRANAPLSNALRRLALSHAHIGPLLPPAPEAELITRAFPLTPTSRNHAISYSISFVVSPRLHTHRKPWLSVGFFGEAATVAERMAHS